MTVTPKTKDTQRNKYLLLELFEDTEEKNKLNLQITNKSKFGNFLMWQKCRDLGRNFANFLRWKSVRKKVSRVGT